MEPYKQAFKGRSEYKGLLLDFNERTFPLPTRIIRELAESLKRGKLQIYPEYFDLEREIANYAGMKPDEVMVTNGSDRAIEVIFRTFTDKGDKVIIPKPSFSMFFKCAQIMGNKVISPLYKKDSFSFPLEEVLDLIDKSVRLVVICNPNNPTGTIISLEDIEKIVRRARTAIVYIDEAYFEFSKITAVSLLKKYSNIVISRTFSKAFGLAALRIGYVLGRREHIAEMVKIRGPYDVNIAAYLAAKIVLEEKEEMEKYVNEVISKAKPFVEAFFRENDILFYPSWANFILFRPNSPKKTVRLLAENGVILRPQKGGNMGNLVRLTIGTKEQMEEFIKIYKSKILKNSKKKYAFIDRDGTLIYEPQDTYQIDGLSKLKILDGVIGGLRELKRLGYTQIMVSNQDGLGTPSFPFENFLAPHKKMVEIFRKNGIEFKKIFICPHLPEDGCNCRKPKTGLVEEFLKIANIDRKTSFVCGDREGDRKFAKNIGFKFVPMKTNGNFYKSIKLFLTKTI